MKYTLQQNAYQGFTPVEIDVPDSWQVQWNGIVGDDAPALTMEQIKQKLNRPYGSPTLKELARDAKKVCIVFDDISRGTPTRIMAEAVLDELLQAGVQKDQIRFLCALGTHGAHNRMDFVQKLGEKILHDYPVYNHNCYENNICIGKTERGYDVCINKEFMDCDLRIGLGALTPHTFNAFGGGGKILFPGLASIETITQNHDTAVNYIRDNKINTTACMGDLSVSGMREEIEEMTRMVGQFFKVDCIYNTKLELIDLYAGDPIEEYYAAVPAAQKLYAMPSASDMDIVIVNANAKGNEASIASSLASMALTEKGGDIVLVDHTKMGQVTHYLFGSFGVGGATGGRRHGKLPKQRPQVNRYICWMPYPDHSSSHWFGEIDKQIYVDTWEEVMDLLVKAHGDHPKVCIIADGTISYYSRE